MVGKDYEMLPALFLDICLNSVHKGFVGVVFFGIPEVIGKS